MASGWLTKQWLEPPVYGVLRIEHKTSAMDSMYSTPMYSFYQPAYANHIQNEQND